MSSGAARLVPTPSTDYYAVAAAFASLGLSRSEVPLPGADSASDKEIWLTKDHQTAAVWIKDDLLDVSYISVHGRDAEALIEQIRSVLPTDDISRLRARMITDRDSDALIDSIYRTAVVSCAGFDPQAFALLQWTLRDPDPLIRRVALLAVSVTSWSAFSPILEEMSEQDPVDEVRDQAVRVLSILRPGDNTSAE
ncbi:HEAT repeat domain-containing protein [Streptomyces pratensis]|uniref:HEAT repeat domain-containing protein n=1 Tax=Streptomyces pratensis TaxID=1169025 RepID=UPI00301905C0